LRTNINNVGNEKKLHYIPVRRLIVNKFKEKINSIVVYMGKKGKLIQFGWRT
jgi:hypothetical protein